MNNKEYQRIYREMHKEESKAYAAKYNKTHKEEKKHISREYYLKNKSKIQQKNLLNKDKITLTQKAYYEANKEHLKECARKRSMEVYIKEHPDSKRIIIGPKKTEEELKVYKHQYYIEHTTHSRRIVGIEIKKYLPNIKKKTKESYISQHKQAFNEAKEEWLKQNALKVEQNTTKKVIVCKLCGVLFVKNNSKHIYCNRYFCYKPWWRHQNYLKRTRDEVTGEIKKIYPLVSCLHCQFRWNINFDPMKEMNKFNSLECPSCHKQARVPTYDEAYRKDLRNIMYG